jgi:DNA-binding response OmpR family regulator
MVILYVEDDPEDRDIFKEALLTISPHHTCLFAHDGKHAFEILEEFLPDYIFLDINMPGMEGKEILRELKSSTGLKSVPVIMFTTSDAEKDKVECKRLGAVDYIKKPTMFSDLCATLKKYL